MLFSVVYYSSTSLAAVFMYEKRGYKTVGHGKYDLDNDVKLVYEIMEKTI